MVSKGCGFYQSVSSAEEDHREMNQYQKLAERRAQAILSCLGKLVFPVANRKNEDSCFFIWSEHL